MLHALTLAATLLAPPQVEEVVWTLVRDESRTLLRDNPALRRMSPRGLPQALLFYSCMEIEDVRVLSVEPVENGRRYLFDIAGEGTILGAARTREALPRLWSMTVAEVDGKPMMTEIEREDIRLSKLLKTGTPREIEEMLHTRPDVDQAEMMAYVAEYAADETEAGRAALDFCIEHARRTGVRLQWALSMKSSAELNRGDPDSALALAQESLAVARDADEIAGATFAVGIAHWYKGELDRAGRLLDEAFSYIDRVRDPRLPLMAAHMATHMDSDRGNLSAIVRRTLLAQSWAREIDWKEGASNASSSLGNVHLDLGNWDLAEEAYREAHDLAYTIADRERQAFALHNLAVLASSRGAHAEARELIDRAIAVMPKKSAVLLYRSGSLHLAAGNRAAAVAAAKEATEVARANDDRHSLTRAMALTATILLEEGKAAEAAAHAEEALRRWNEWIEGEGREVRLNVGDEARMALARALRKLGRTDAARKVLEEAVSLSESLMPDLPDIPEALTRYYGGEAYAHQELATVLAEEGETTEAMAVSARLKARSLQLVLARGKIDASPSFSPEEVAKEGELENALTIATRRMLSAAREDSALRDTVTAARKNLEKYRAELYLRHPETSLRRPALQSFDPAALRDPRLRDVLILDFLVNEERVLVLAIEPGRDLAVTHATIPIERKELTRRVDRYLQKLVSRDLRAGQDAVALYDLLLRPVAPALRRYSRICIIPDGPLWNVPFQTLGPARTKPMAEEKALFFVPSLAFLTASPAKPASPTQECLAVANPSFPGMREATRFATVRALPKQSLVDAAREGRSLLEIYDDGVLLESGEATEEKVTETVGRFRIVHFATHGIVDANAPMYSALLLAASSDREDGALEAREIANLRLSADLAVLSACDTARGKVASGEGVIGLAWAFAVAGCPRTVASQWQVDSRATADLMISFHRHVRKGVPPSEALRRAQIALRKQPRYRHPYYWAPFIVIGDGMTGLF